MRPIDADALDDFMLILNFGQNRGITRAEYKLIESVLFEFPTIDAVPVRHGRWVERWVDNKHRIGDRECSVCGGVMLDCPSYSLYCPWCGARMDAERKEE